MVKNLKFNIFFLIIVLSFLGNAKESFSKELINFNEDRCFSCDIRVKNLDDPMKLNGLWLFTRADQVIFSVQTPPEKLAKLIKVPGSWSTQIGEIVDPPVGWYFAQLEFDDEFIGTTVSLTFENLYQELTVYANGRFVNPSEGVIKSISGVKTGLSVFNIDVQQKSILIAIRSYDVLGVGPFPKSVVLRKFGAFSLNSIITEVFQTTIRPSISFSLYLVSLFIALCYGISKVPSLLYASLATLMGALATGLNAGVSFIFLSPLQVQMLQIPALFFTQYFLNRFSMNIYEKQRGTPYLQAFASIIIIVLLVRAFLYFSFENYVTLVKASAMMAVPIMFHTMYNVINNKKYSKTRGYFPFITCYAAYTLFLLSFILKAFNISIIIFILMPIFHLILFLSLAYFALQILFDGYRSNIFLLKKLRISNAFLEKDIIEKEKDLDSAIINLRELERDSLSVLNAKKTLDTLGEDLTLISAEGRRISDLCNPNTIESLKVLNHLNFISKGMPDKLPKGMSKEEYLKNKYYELSENLEGDFVSLRETLIEMNSTIKACLQLHKDLSQYVKIGSEVNDISLEGLVNDVVQSFDQKFEKSNIIFNTRFEKIGKTYANENHLFQVLTSLIEFSLSLYRLNPDHTLPRIIEITIWDQWNKNIITIRSYGQGMKEADLQSFLDHTANTKYRNEVISFDQCKDDITEMGGFLEAYSEGPDTGVQFNIGLNKAN